MQTALEHHKELFETYCRERFALMRQQASGYLSQLPESAVIFEAMEYSFFSGGKRFRPLLGLTLAEALRIEAKRCYPWLLAIEMIHTYSLIHDDLPAMDNSDIRRGRPSCHKQFREDIAILAGDALCAQAFWELADAYQGQPQELLPRLTCLLSEAIGPRGIVLGQVMDIQSKLSAYTKEQVLLMHQLKTGLLFQVVFQGVGLIGGWAADKLESLNKLGLQIGLAFQIKDDLLDSKEDEIEPGSLPAVLGLAETKKLLEHIQKEMQDTLSHLGIPLDSSLAYLIELNESRSL